MSFPVLNIEHINTLPTIATNLLSSYLGDIEASEQNRLNIPFGRDVDLVEGLGGNFAVSDAMRNKGYSVAHMMTWPDVSEAPSLHRFMRELLQVRPGGVVWMWAEPTWNTDSGRVTTNPRGDEQNVTTHTVNLQTPRIALLLLLAVLRQVHVVIESYDSMVFGVEPLRSVTQWLNEHAKHRLDTVWTYMGAFGHVQARPRLITTTLTNVGVLARSCPSGQDLANNVDDNMGQLEATWTCDHTPSFGEVAAMFVSNAMRAKIPIQVFLKIPMACEDAVWAETVTLARDIILDREPTAIVVEEVLLEEDVEMVMLTREVDICIGAYVNQMTADALCVISDSE